MERWIARVPRDIMNIVFVVVAIFGAILWSLYIINPPGVDEQNKHPEMAEEIQKQEEQAKIAAERDDVSDAINAYSAMNGSMRELVNSSTALSDDEKLKMLADLDAIDKNIDDMKSQVSEASAETSSDASA